MNTWNVLLVDEEENLSLRLAERLRLRGIAVRHCAKY